ncbi:MAG TPA: hypothetical protein VF711_00900 [Acidimicrobiales bacterium]|jgi:hypothetical protein
MTEGATTDPVHQRRARAAQLAALGKKTGYSLFLVAIAAFVAGAIGGFSTPYVTVVVACLAVGSVLLAPAIVIGYGVKAAEREERGGGSFH